MTRANGGLLDKSFRLAPMSAPVWALTSLVLILPPAFLVASIVWRTHLALPGIILVILYAWVWVRFRPSRFVVAREGLRVVWPLKHTTIPRSEIMDVRLLDAHVLRREIGWGVRIGVGGLWGGFGWLWTKRHGIVQMYISRTDRFVWIERGDARAWLITPIDPEAFVRALVG